MEESNYYRLYSYKAICRLFWYTDIHVSIPHITDSDSLTVTAAADSSDDDDVDILEL